MIIATNASNTVQIGIAPTQVKGFYIRTKTSSESRLQAVCYAAAIAIAKKAGISHYLFASPY